MHHLGCFSEASFHHLVITLVDTAFSHLANNLLRATPTYASLADTQLSLLARANASGEVPAQLDVSTLGMELAAPLTQQLAAVVSTRSTTFVERTSASFEAFVSRPSSLLEQNRKRRVEGMTGGQMLSSRARKRRKAVAGGNAPAPASEEVLARNRQYVLDMLTLPVLAHSSRGAVDPKRVRAVARTLYAYVKPAVALPSRDEYREVLPARPASEAVVATVRMFSQNPLVWEVLETLVPAAPVQFCRYLDVFRALLAWHVGSWHLAAKQAKVRSPSASAAAEAALRDETAQLLRILAAAQWFPRPLSALPMMLDGLRAGDMVDVLTALWNFALMYPATVDAFRVQPDSIPPVHVRVFPSRTTQAATATV
ncbi:uncharacterized protein AMSG_09198 [Thecamonas trahens ATCC 50062]|uniref:Integrator complex subunit 5 C-terminal domain-containing protein n=1 Tax=Thecamonas trahens ATCC 50062 TaxID=461836 RepID=A0A0L0DL26_THETB|nr:hypothetical protein AMSG_09198 [Thecamonas trahens ATCC 50062]KNC53017.1 hypothetical protein AMSG_09198 [Thecamonas trahens ATCC 50062]|eukprot:XP_013754903.1 hypothetical protein AMSG_09198 [Thecamonas trahens ATCC 50062]